MTTVGVFSVKGSPGATTLALALTARAREHGAVLIEADLAGGDLALRFGVPQAPGLAQAAARAGKTSARRALLDGLVRTVDGDGANAVDLLPAPVEPAAVRAAVTALAEHPETLAEAGTVRPVILDLGRLDAHSLALGLLAACDAAVLVVRGDAVSLGHASEAAWLAELPVRCGFVLVDTGPYRAAEAADALDLPHLATVPFAREPLRARSAGKAVRALWTTLATPAVEPRRTPELVEVNSR